MNKKIALTILGLVAILIVIGLVREYFEGMTQTSLPPPYSLVKTQQLTSPMLPEMIVSYGPVPVLVPPNAQAEWDMFFENYGVNPFVSTEDDALSTFAMDVDTGSYTVMRNYINRGNLPPKDSVRTEEYINYFDQGYEKATDTFSIFLDGAQSKFGEENKHLLRIGIKAKDVSLEERKPANIVFVVDVSGSMNMENRLGLVKKSINLLVDNLKDEDKIGLAIYGSRGEKVLDLTSDKQKILNAVEELRSGGVTNAEEGIKIGYEMLSEGFEKGKINRVIIMSDGVANVGRTGHEGIFKQVKKYSEKGITLSTIGFGMGNYNDVLMEQLANHGDGNYAYIDTYNEARRLFGDGLTGLLQVIASDAKIQVEFNPETVDRYRLIGYENRALKDEDFRNDSVDAGEVGAGQSVTALYELRFKDNLGINEPESDQWKIKLGLVKIRYQNMETGKIETTSKQILKRAIDNKFENANANFRFTSAIAEFAEILKESYWAKDGNLSEVLKVLEGTEIQGEKELEFIQLVKNTISIKEEEK